MFSDFTKLFPKDVLPPECHFNSKSVDLIKCATIFEKSRKV